MADSKSKKSSEKKKEKQTAKPKKAKEMEIITTVKRIREAVKCNSVLKSYLIFQDILNYEEDALKDHEHFWVMGIDVAGYVVCVYIVAIGTENRLILDPIDILDIAITKKAKRIVLAHNHPGQDMKNVFPSKNDIDFTNRIFHASKPFGFYIADHIIICDDGYFSFLSENLIDAIEDMKDYKPYKDVEPEIIKERKEYGIDKLIEGIDKGEHNKTVEIVKNLLKNNVDIDIIISSTGLSKKDIMKIKNEMK